MPALGESELPQFFYMAILCLGFSKICIDCRKIINFWVHDLLVKNTHPPPGGGMEIIKDPEGCGAVERSRRALLNDPGADKS